VRSADGRDRLTESHVIRVHQPEIAQAEVGHGARGRADIQRVSCRNEDDCEFGSYSVIVADAIIPDRFQASRAVPAAPHPVAINNPGRANQRASHARLAL
ncbi:MAG TPA: hypothetical protein VHB50_13455, partial [Bryobacteraceae bacterium]|nr:hypothetical protein [Bryobacteraceae bacterium]